MNSQVLKSSVFSIELKIILLIQILVESMACFDLALSCENECVSADLSLDAALAEFYGSQSNF